MAEYIDRNLIEWYGCNFETPECESENRKCSECSHAECSHAQVMQLPSIKVKDNPTNGDMIKAMFPKIEIYTDVINEIVDVEICEDSSELRCSIGWWNAPYKRGDSDGSN